mmetsp:Transcript_3335/g.3680  ORF Transcript_3335/g.3680 Transcript_3335/m.3680 type:complete len:126 (+) Transcript_3335:333-710(+)
MMKTNSMNIDPKERSPPTIQVKKVCWYQGCGGMYDGSDWMIGVSMAPFLNPRRLPKNTSGLEIPPHNKHTFKIVLKSAAAEDLSAAAKKLEMQKTAKLMPGYNDEVTKAQTFQLVPPNTLKILAE